MLVSESIGVNIGVGVDAEVAVGVGLGVRAGKMFRVGDGAAVDVGSSVAAAATVEILVGDSSVSDVGNGTGWVQAHVVRASAIRRPTTRAVPSAYLIHAGASRLMGACYVGVVHWLMSTDMERSKPVL